jgi:predicted Fe-S protein YdhL (DUF1289 family)
MPLEQFSESPFVEVSILAESNIPSPCIGVCTLDRSGAICVGCFRTLDEIRAWARLSNEQKREILLKLSSREAQFDVDSNLFNKDV